MCYEKFKLCWLFYFILFATALLPISAYSEVISARGVIPFSTYDKDGNNFIIEKEFNEVRAERMAKRAAEGGLMRGAANAPSFSVFDTNKDGQLSQVEFALGQKSQMEKRRSMRMGPGSEMDVRRNMPGFLEYDLDRDGEIIEQEFNEARSKRITEKAQQGYQMRNLGNAPLFTDIDINMDGRINPEEFASHQSQRRKINQRQFSSNSITSPQDVVSDPRKLVTMPEKARDIMRKDMRNSLATLNTILGYLVSNDFKSASEAAEKSMGKSSIGKHRGSAAPPGWFMPNEMRNLGWSMHEAASEFAEVAKQGDINDSLKSLNKLTSSCVACHYTYRTH